MIRKKRMGKGIAKILSGLLVFGMVAGVVPAVPHGTLQVQAANEKTQQLCDRLLADAQRKANAIVAQAQQEADGIRAMTDEGAQEKWAEWQEKAETMMKSYEALRLALQK